MLMAQIVAVVIFLAMFMLIVMDKIEKHHITLGCGVLTLVVVFGMIMKDGDAIIRTLNLDSIFTTHFWYSAGSSASQSTGINWETIIFLAGMMVCYNHIHFLCLCKLNLTGRGNSTVIRYQLVYHSVYCRYDGNG